VNINGAVERPGAYELTEGENLSALVMLYGGGAEVLADQKRLHTAGNENNGKVKQLPLLL